MSLIGALMASLVEGVVSSVFIRPDGQVNGPFAALVGSLLSFALSGLCFYVYFFVGSSGPNALVQMRTCLGIAILFLLGGTALAICSLSAFRRR